MASLSISKSFGQTEFQIVAGTSAPGAGDIELRINLAHLPGNEGSSSAGNMGSADVQAALNEFANYIMGKTTSIN